VLLRQYIEPKAIDDDSKAIDDDPSVLSSQPHGGINMTKFYRW
jgi:hypothetical protein